MEQHGLEYGYMNDELLGILDTDQGRDLMENTTGIFQVIKQTLTMLKRLGPMQRSLFQDGWEATKRSQPHLIIFHPKAYGGPDYAEKIGARAVLGLVIPMLVPTSERPHMGFPQLKLGGWYNRLTYKVVSAIMAFSGARYSREWRAQHGLPKVQSFDLLHQPNGFPRPVLCGFSRHVVPPPSDWTDDIQTTGYWFLKEAPEWTPSRELQDFLEAGPPPIYVGFGSMAGRKPERLAGIVVESLEETGQRGIIATGWGGLKAQNLPPTILQITQAPHSWLFPRMAAIVHHGGAGTTAAALRSGRPSIVIPFFGDQPYWGSRLHELGVAPAPIPQKKLRPRDLTLALRSVLTDSRLRAKAERLGQKIRAEQGVESAVNFVERLLSQGHS